MQLSHLGKPTRLRLPSTRSSVDLPTPFLQGTIQLLVLKPVEQLVYMRSHPTACVETC
jgi:hypothetical protein